MPRIHPKPEISDEQPRLLDRISISPGQPVDLAVWSVKSVAIQCKTIPDQLPVTYRLVRHDIEGEIITVVPSKIWQFKKTVYIAGETIGSRLDARALGLTPLSLEDLGRFDPDQEEDLLEEDDPHTRYYLPIMAYGPRREFRMEQVIPFEDPDDGDSDPITESVGAYEQGDYQRARQILKEMLAEDLRCIDAHAHLGNWDFDSEYLPPVERAKRHYEAGLRIAELSWGADFHDLLPWGYINNRPYLRCLHGYGLCLWRLGNPQAARDVFERMLWLNPRDNQGARFLLAMIDAGKPWTDVELE